MPRKLNLLKRINLGSATAHTMNPEDPIHAILKDAIKHKEPARFLLSKGVQTRDLAKRGISIRNVLFRMNRPEFEPDAVFRRKLLFGVKQALAYGMTAEEIAHIIPIRKGNTAEVMRILIENLR